jgi:GntR family transcriptional regulator
MMLPDAASHQGGKRGRPQRPHVLSERGTDGEPKLKEPKNKPRPAKQSPADPLYLRVARTLRDEIVSGTYPVGSHLPPEDKLSERFSVSRFTVRDALRRLREENLVASRKGSGTVVVSPSSSDSRTVHAVSVDDLLAYASEMRRTIETIGLESVGGELASQLGIAAGDRWLAVRGIGWTMGDDLPNCWAEYYINREFAAIGRVLRGHSGAIFPLIEDMFGQRIVEVNQQITAALVPRNLTKVLQVKVHSVALIVRRTYRTAQGKIAQVTLVTHPASRFSHAMTMRRTKNAKVGM